MAGKRRKGCLITLAIFVTIFVIVGFRIHWDFRALRDIFGIYQKSQEKIPDAKYIVSREANLKAIYTALMLAHESDGQLPPAKEWMDAIKTRLRTTDLAESEAIQKLQNPTIQAKPGVWGYAMNSKLAGQFKGDIKNPDTTTLVFESKNTNWNASGDPGKDRESGGWSISVSGKIIRP